MGRARHFTDAERKLRGAAHTRWSKLVHTRIAQRMKPLLGTRLWAEFVREALQRGKPLFIAAFTAKSMWCRGTIEGIECHHKHLLTSQIHADHSIDLNHICTAWAHALPRVPRSWCDGIDAKKLMSMLFEFRRGRIVFRCESCHSHLPHYNHTITPADLAICGTKHNPIVLE